MMRRILAAGLLGLAVLAASGCADKAPTASGSPSAQAAGISKEQACAKLKAASDEFEAKGMPVVTELVTDPSKAEAKLPEVMAIFNTFITAYGADVASISDPDLKAAVEADLATLKDAASRIAAGTGDVQQLAAVLTSPEFQTAGDKVAEICGS